MTTDQKTILQNLVDWYRRLVHPFLTKVESPKAVEFEQDIERLIARDKKSDEELAICFLGSSGVGKSTLINALVAGKEILLPAGGVGPLTAQALTVRYGETRRFEVRYHGLRNLWKVVWVLQEIHKKQLAAAMEVGASGDANGPAQQLDPESLAEVQRDLFLAPDAGPEERVQRSERVEQYKKLAQLMVKGNQDISVDMGYLADSLRTVLGMPMHFKTEILPEDQNRLTRLREALQYAKSDRPYSRESSENDPAFRNDLKAHASGFLAPLIKAIDIYWNSEVLKDGVSLVDLPGVGIAGDIHREVTHYWIREKAKGIVLVVDSRGITEESAQLLWKSGFLNALLHSADDPIDDPLLMVAVVKVDEIAESVYDEDDTKSKAEHFQDVCVESIQKVRGQLEAQLEKVWSLEGQGVSTQKRQVIENILNTLQIHPVSAIQYRRVLKNSRGDSPFITDADESNVPGLLECIKALAAERKGRQVELLKESTQDFFDRAMGTLKLIEGQWQEDTRATDDALQLRSEVMEFIEPHRKDFYSRQGAYREFLKNSIPQKIEAMVGEASRKAEKDIQAYLSTLEGAHWATLRAAVTRGGTFYGSRHIDLPADFALRFEEPIAEVWGKSILREIRTKTKDFADDCVLLVEELITWAKKQGARVNPELTEAQRDAIKADAKRLNTVGKEMLEELRTRVKTDLIKSIQNPIKIKCKRFVDRGDAMGRGVKRKILEMFKELADEVVTAACDPAIQLLTANFKIVEEEIRATLKQYDDPLLTAADAIVASHETRTRRSDAQRRKAVLQDLETILTAAPQSPTTPDDARSVAV